MNGPPNAERRPQGDHPETGDVLTTSTTPILPRLGCPRGCELSGPHICGIGEPIPAASFCGTCSTLEVHELRLMGWQYGGCVHRAVAA